MIPISGYYPDADPTKEGVLTDVVNMIPTTKGSYKASPSRVDAGFDPLASESMGAALVVKMDASTRFFVGTDEALFEGSSLAWSDVSKGAGYTTGAKFWRFAQFGDITLATNKIDTLQYAGTAFDDVAGAPKARYIDCAAGFVMLADTNEATYGDQSDRWWCSAYQDYSDWTPDVTTQCTTGRLVDAPGPIRGLKALGSSFVIYKEKSMFLGTYSGAPAVWSWDQIKGDIGCASNESIISIGTSHFFIGKDDIYSFDGSLPQPIGTGIKEWFFTSLNSTYASNIRGLHDKAGSSVWWFFPTNDSSSGSCNAAIVYNYKSQKWGKVSMSVECVVEYSSGQETYTSLGTTYATYHDLPSVSYDSPFWTASSQSGAVFGTDHTLYTLTGSASDSSITFGDVGDDAQYSTLRRVRPRLLVKPTTATMTNQYKDELSDNLTTDETSGIDDSKFDVMRSSRWHRVSISFTGEVEIAGVAYDLAQDGLQ